MYTKTGLSLLAAAGVAFGVIGMQTGGANASNNDCLTPTATATSPALTGIKSKPVAISKNAPNPAHLPATNSGRPGPTTSPTAGSNGGNTGGTITVIGRTPGGTGSGSATLPTPAVPTAPSTSTSTNPFLDVNAGTNASSSTGGTVPAPPTATHIVGRSPYLGSLLNLKANANAGH